MSDLEKFLLTLEWLGLDCEMLFVKDVGMFVWVGSVCHVFDEHGKAINRDDRRLFQ